MDLGILATKKHILDWDESDVHQWFRHLGCPQYETQIRSMSSFIHRFIRLLIVPIAHRIQGDSLCTVDLEGLKSLGIATIGQRLSILKAIYLVKLAQNVLFNEDDYIPPCSSTIYLTISLT